MIRISKQVTESLLLLLQLDAYGDSAYHKSRQLAQDLNASQDSLVKTLRILVLGGLVESSSKKTAASVWPGLCMTSLWQTSCWPCAITLVFPGRRKRLWPVWIPVL